MPKTKRSFILKYECGLRQDGSDGVFEITSSFIYDFVLV